VALLVDSRTKWISPLLRACGGNSDLEMTCGAGSITARIGVVSFPSIGVTSERRDHPKRDPRSDQVSDSEGGENSHACLRTLQRCFLAISRGSGQPRSAEFRLL